jgi:hypothetical protein
MLNAEVEASPVNVVPLTFTVHVLEAAFHSGTTDVTVGTVLTKVNLQVFDSLHYASSEVFKKTTSLPTRLADFS